ncbi:MAG: hypothetical protein H0T76_07025 [Nannocystis sp.]|nr:hypothetical protein [Nannocystis sp.]MBA3546215.1 hypothetical protein [Nannocystis sp.]
MRQPKARADDQGDEDQLDEDEGDEDQGDDDLDDDDDPGCFLLDEDSDAPNTRSGR